MLAEPALDVPALVVERLGKAVAHGAPVSGLGPAAPCVAAVESDDGLPDAEVFPAKAVVVLGVIACITQSDVDAEQPRRLAHGRGEVWRVLARAETRHGAEQEVRVRMEHRRQLGPGALSMAFSLGPLLAEVGADVPGLEAGRIHGHHRCGVDQAVAAGASDHVSLYADESPPALASARMRREAWANVE